MYRFLLVFCCSLCLISAVDGAIPTSIEWLDLTGWDDDMITSTGQTFTDVCDGVDLTVTGSPDHTRTSFFDSDLAIRTGGDKNTHSFTFSFTSMLPVVVSVDSLDAFEQIVIANTGGGAVTYSHLVGSPPTESGNLTLAGTGIGQDVTTGAAEGLLDLGLTSEFTWEYTATASNKFEKFMVGKIVPEPCTASLACLSSLFALGLRRRR